jgi:methylglutaconyl-CoA hydratase
VTSTSAEGSEQGPFVHFDQRGSVLRLVLDSPHNRNALSRQLLAELQEAFVEVAGDPAIRVIVLTGAGPVFCSGADLSERLHPPKDSAGPAPVSYADVLSAIAASPLPVIARVNGHVRAGGMGLVAACDLAVAPPSATFAFTEVRVGVAPAIIAVPALSVMARRDLVRYALTGEVFGADTACTAGLLSAVVPDEGLDSWVEGVVTSFLKSSPGAVARTKALLADLRLREWKEGLARASAVSEELFRSAEASEGMAAFLAKRPPAWVEEHP